jgi:hypothetical protein
MSLLIPAGAETGLPVSCVEAGRWDGRRSREAFAPSPHAADPELRRIKRSRANLNARHGAPPRAEQNEVWERVSSRLVQHGVESPSSALSSIYEAKRAPLDVLREPIFPVDGQVGALVEICGQPVALDLVSRPDVLTELLPRLADGYALQALGAPADAVRRPSREAARGFLAATLEADHSRLPKQGLGDGFAISQKSIDGAGLIVEGELVALCAFPAGHRVQSGVS